MIKPPLVASLACALLLSACEPNAPEEPHKRPTPNAVAAPENADAPKPTLTSRLDAGGRAMQYSAFFEDSQLTQIDEAPLDTQAPIAQYHFRGARLLKYSQAGVAGETTVLELDERGQVQRALAGTRALAATEIDAIRTRAQLLRSHALAQQASRLHAQS